MTIEVEFLGGPHNGLVLPMPDSPPLTVTLGDTSPLPVPSLVSMADGVMGLMLAPAGERMHEYVLSYRAGLSYDYMGPGRQPAGSLELSGEGNP